MPMSPRLLRPVTSGFHPEAQVWRNAVIANGGSVSAATVKAVSDFCKSIDQAGIRSKFYRLNLFAGTGLNACLVPLYRGPSRTGTQYGNTTDTNSGPFVSGDYSEATGLTGGATNSGKYLETGLTPDDVGVATGHMSIYLATYSQKAQSRRPLGSRNGNPLYYDWQIGTNTNNLTGFWGPAASNSTVTVSAGMFLLQRESSVLLRTYVNGSLSNTNTSSASPGASTTAFNVFNTNDGGSPIVNQYLDESVGAYSFGEAMTSTGVSDFYTALQAFQTALGRNA